MALGSTNALGAAYLQLRADRSQLRSDLAGARQDVSSALSGMAGMMGGILGAIGVTSFVNTVKSIGAAFIDSNAEVERFQASFEIMLGSAGKAKSLLDDIRKMASVTPFETGNLAAGVQMLINAGEPAERVLETMRKIGDASAASPRGLSESLSKNVLAISQMLSKQKIAGGEMLQLTESGVPVWDILAQKMGISVAQLQKLSETGKLGMAEINMLIDGMGERFAGMMDKQSRTFNGLMSTLADRARETAQKVGEPFFALAKIKVDGLLKFLESPTGRAAIEAMTGAMRMFVVLLDNPISRGIGKLLLLAAATKGVQVAFRLLGPIATKALAGIVGLFGLLASPIGLVVAGLTAIAALIVRAFEAPGAEKARKTLGEIWELLQEIGGNLARGFGALWDRIADKLGNMIPTLRIDGFLDFIRDALDGLSLLTTNFELTFQLLQVYGEMAAITLENVFSAAWATIGRGGQEAIAFIASQFHLLGQVAQTVAQIIVAAFDNVFQALGAVTGAALGGLISEFLKEMGKPDPRLEKLLEKEKELLEKMLQERDAARADAAAIEDEKDRRQQQRQNNEAAADKDRGKFSSVEEYWKRIMEGLNAGKGAGGKAGQGGAGQGGQGGAGQGGAGQGGGFPGIGAAAAGGAAAGAAGGAFGDIAEDVAAAAAAGAMGAGAVQPPPPPDIPAEGEPRRQSAREWAEKLKERAKARAGMTNAERVAADREMQRARQELGRRAAQEMGRWEPAAKPAPAADGEIPKTKDGQPDWEKLMDADPEIQRIRRGLERDRAKSDAKAQADAAERARVQAMPPGRLRDMAEQDLREKDARQERARQRMGGAGGMQLGPLAGLPDAMRGFKDAQKQKENEKLEKLAADTNKKLEDLKKGIRITNLDDLDVRSRWG